ncbi:MAG: radical SAM protein, partial [Candidatus Njordarchaeales archaeon]
RICYEWNGAGNSNLVKTVGKQVLESGGIIKFDLKAPNNELSYALSGVRNDTAFRNFKMLYDLYWHERSEVPIITATTLLVPGYIGPEEVEEIAKFISEIDRKIPYSLLVFHPAFILNDLPITPKKVAIQSLERARRYLDNVHLGNQFLLGLAPNELI